ncbi:MAG: sigma-54-dependent Fis family transcriptional regulator, partial [Deltaproteobacteria bacterium]|nr:sigma-54-dependent Fis family transcriptional regulator [Deltaproteobacteria bacterium]
RFRRVGGRKEIGVDVRLLTATNRDLRSEVNTGRFRLDLYYRLAVTRIAIPPLRERPEDIGVLVEHFVREIEGSSMEFLASAETLESLCRQRWSGNVRELRNVIEATVALGRLSLEQTASVEKEGSYKEARAEALARFERTFLGELIERHDGNASRAARAAKMDRPYLLTLLRRHGLR